VLTATIVGNIGGDPEMKYTQNGQAFLRWSMAHNQRDRQQDGSYTDRAVWVRVTVYGDRAEALSKFLRKGMKVTAQGRLDARPWVSDRDNSLNAGLEMVAADIEVMSPRDDNGQQNGHAGNGQANGRQPAAAGQPQQRRRAAVTDDQLPF
jgi:single-strand DNA-binding protein